MSILGFSMDLSQLGSVAFGEGIGDRPFVGWPQYPRSINYSPVLTFGMPIRGDEYSIGPEGGVSYTFMENYAGGHHNLGLFAGVRGDFLSAFAEDVDQFWGLRLSLGYKAEIFQFADADDDDIVDDADHGVYAGFYVLHSMQDRCEGNDDHFTCAGRNDAGTGTAFVQSAGVWGSYFPEVGRGAVGLSYSLGFEV